MNNIHKTRDMDIASEKFRQKIRQSRLRLYGQVKHWDYDYVGRKVLEMQFQENSEDQRGGIWMW